MQYNKNIKNQRKRKSLQVVTALKKKKTFKMSKSQLIADESQMAVE